MTFALILAVQSIAAAAIARRPRDILTCLAGALLALSVIAAFVDRFLP